MESVASNIPYSDDILTALNNSFIEPKIKVIGVGGAGCNMIHELRNHDLNVETIALNTDELRLQRIEADKKVLIGKNVTKGLGAGGYPEVAEYATELARNDLVDLVKDADIVFLVAGMGGGTGTGTTPILAEIAKEYGAVVIGVVILPFSIEGERYSRALQGVENLKALAQSVIVIDNNKLLSFSADLSIGQSFSIVDKLVVSIIRSVTDAISGTFLTSLVEDIGSIIADIEATTCLEGGNIEKSDSETLPAQLITASPPKEEQESMDEPSYKPIDSINDFKPNDFQS